ncbi:MAG: hypothetical protein F6K22_25075 [Okeania sp. SIO2F4]|uniref:hypothetical protein n=1 Tax=Okeania sp. SIO2F4 TaxID=2607790 RepID=UPI00142BDF1D|nr:hypothetical protein [Okeania sp. SIO2F4]NES05795.1 hypothetical protein [Okeania sp. SIO2F4]
MKQKYFNPKIEVQNAADNLVEVSMLFGDVKTIDLTVEIAKANYELPENKRLQLFGGDTLYNCKTLNKGQQAVKGLILVVPWHKELDAAKPFLDRAKPLWGGDVAWRTATSYDATKAFLDALSNSGTNPTRSTILEKLKEVNLPPEETSGQNLRFNPDGEPLGKPMLVEVVESNDPYCSYLNFHLVEE